MDTRGSRFLDPSSAMAAITRHKAEAIKLAREQGTAVKEMCRRAKTDAPPYEFEELIGKGAYGRVYKGRQIPSGRLVAIKVLDIDSLDYKSQRDFRDESIKDFIHETKVMKQVKDSGAQNINELIEAISIHSQLWLVCEYCPGGSVRTLMRATGDKLDEKYIIPIARELAVGLRAIHEAGIIHRDVKAANILVHEEGRLEICDFGVAGILQSQRDKRSTWIGTPHWMPPEMFGRGPAHRYSSEVDVWAFGCTLYEFANGSPPNAGLREPMQIGRQLNRTAPKLNNDNYSQGLQELIAFVLEPDPANRPTMADVLEHPYIAGTEEEYPTSSVGELVRNYYQWSQRGGQRISLFNPGGAQAAEMPDVEEPVDDWNFSTTDGFERRFSVIDLDQIAASLAEMEEPISPTTPAPENDSGEEMNISDMDPEERANFDERVRRGAAAMEGLFNEEMPSYKYETKNDFVPIQPAPPTSDLPLRTDTDRSSVMSTLIDIDIGSFDSSHYAAGAPTAQPFQLANADTIRANRHRNSNENSSQSSNSGHENEESQEEAFQPQTGPRPPTMDWKFPSFAPPSDPEDEPEAKAEETPAPAASAPEEPFQAEKRATMQWTFPVMGADTSDSVNSDSYDTLRAPLPGIQEQKNDTPGESRPSTSASNKSTMSDSDSDPFRFDRPKTPQDSLHQPTPSFGSALGDPSDEVEDDSPGMLDGPGPDEEDQPEWSETSSVDDLNDMPLPTAIPLLDGPGESPIIASEPGSPVYEEPLQTARRDVVSMTMRQATNPKEDESGAPSFPHIVSPSVESLMEGIDDNTVTMELDRLLGDFLGALAATGDALSRAGPGQQTDEVKRASEVGQ
ncbi:hypothetical protein N7448_004945 [Penicillium atrosanguineum]|uniref:non-specific serine/threonine protein kinase n=1 Tax=Penicillium atrosanguineum TaxID=1132637 RepID=A0A9W9PPC7_9EURO|nr:uncharacterized protein N7443_008692 [Penicillium atrosanguineum]KAJ5125627.1 hypothetical protein N7526_007804 [Penicillium atrosanguineum]KAJ5136391.1 hypothetical protein N7448_004945 [Penicillium atrosanguineum]KAJ5292739.1 hypothetical protein N7443_008692 [Penicillium atrosanguineum]KAJ5303236.1 hypothetical protein N7476_010035 [Penicillium atrosanguineum]